jgi:O-antigen/teichoic acid export membrane protein
MITLAGPALENAPEPTPETLLTGDPAPVEWAPVVDLAPEAHEPRALPSHVKRHVIRGTSALGASVFVERGAGFVANILAARLGGAQTFGAYSLAVGTANQISTYAAGQIGSTAARFSGKYPHGTPGYPTLRRTLAIVSLGSATIAAAGIYAGAGPIAHVLGKDNLETLLRCAWVSAAGAVLLECARGFFVGQRFIAALLSMSTMVGLGMILLLPYAAHRHSPSHMIELQGAIALGAVTICCLLGRQLGWRGKDGPQQLVESTGRMLREVWSFGFVQLAGLVCSNLAGWWSTALVARSDSTLIQMSFFTIASQLRNLVSLPPSLLTEGSYAVMADPTHERTKTPQRVMALCCFAALSISVMLGALGMIVIPWGLTLLYGKTYAPAGAAVAVALATAVAHMGTAPAAARLTIVSIRTTAVINTIWAVFVAVTSTVFMLHGGSAWCAMSIYFCAHVLSSVLVLWTLQRRDHLPAGMMALFLFSAATVGILAAISVWRGVHEQTLVPTTGMALIFLGTAAGLYGFGRRYAWLPPRALFERMFASVTARLPWGGARV